MKLTFENYKKIIPEEEQGLMGGLLLDLMELNQNLNDKGQGYRALFIDYQDYHNEYSDERTDPCPDYYGYYRLYSEKDPYNHIGLEMTIHDLDDALCLLCNFVETEL